MKYYYCIFLMAIGGLYQCQQPQNTPGKTVLAPPTEGVQPLWPDFTQRFPDAQEVVWDSLEQGFVVDFCDKTGIHQAYYDAKGGFLHTLSYLNEEALPAQARQLLGQKWPQALVAVVFLMEKKGDKTYQVELETESAYINATFDLKGRLLSEISSPLSDEERNRLEEEGVETDD